MERWARAKYQTVLPLGKEGLRVTACREHIELSKDAAKEGMVLLKNEGPVLPLGKGTKIALFGKATFDYVKGGGGLYFGIFVTEGDWIFRGGSGAFMACSHQYV